MRASSREWVLERVRGALNGRAGVAHPGFLKTEVPEELLLGFQERFTKSGGEVVRCDAPGNAGAWLGSFLRTLESESPTVTIGSGVPPAWMPDIATVAPADAAVGVSVACGAAADTGSLLLESTGKRAVQLLPPIHIVWLPTARIFPRLHDALEAQANALPATIGIHSGPSKSADIGRTVVTGVHGPGRIIAVVVEG